MVLLKGCHFSMAAVSITSVLYCSTVRFPRLFLRAVEGCCREREIENLKIGRLESRKDQGRHSTEVVRGAVPQGLERVKGSGCAAAQSPGSAKPKCPRKAEVQQMEPFEP